VIAGILNRQCRRTARGHRSRAIASGTCAGIGIPLLHRGRPALHRGRARLALAYSLKAANFVRPRTANVATQPPVGAPIAVPTRKAIAPAASIQTNQAKRRDRIPIALAAPPPMLHRDFVPWCFSVASRISTRIVASCRRPKTCKSRHSPLTEPHLEWHAIFGKATNEGMPSPPRQTEADRDWFEHCARSQSDKRVAIAARALQ
jgi:hypothetical protein